MSNDQPQTIGKMAVNGIFWSVAKNWGSRLLAFGVLTALARLLAPSQFGIISAALVFLSTAGIIAEFGFGSALIQRRTLEPSDSNLPFFVSLGAVTCLAVLVIGQASAIEAWLNVDGLRPILIALCGLPILTTIAAYQEAHYRRHLAFRQLAFRAYCATAIAGIIAIACAYAGFGVWSLIAQSYISAFVGLVFLWRRPFWVPSVKLNLQSFRQLTGFGVFIVAIRLLDLIAGRIADVTIAMRFGVVALGLYALGFKLYQALMQILLVVLSDVSLPVLSKIADERERVADLYVRSITIAGHVAAPIFTFAAIMAPQICTVLFGAKWHGVAELARPLLLLGAVQSVQSLNGAYLNARGRPALQFCSTAAKASAIVLTFTFFHMSTLASLVIAFAAAQLVAVPVSFGLVMWDMRVRPKVILQALGSALIANLTAWATANLVHASLPFTGFQFVLSGLAVAAVFLAVYLLVLLAVGRRNIAVILSFVQNRVGVFQQRAARA